MLLGLAVLAGALTVVGTEFEGKIRLTQSPEEATPLITEYLDKMTDLEDFRVLQNYWMEIDQQACLDHFTARHLANPGDSESHYLMLRVMTDTHAQYLASRQLVTNSPGFYWGYRIFSTSYSQLLVGPDTAPEIRAELTANRDSDLDLLLHGAQHFPLDEYVNLALFHNYNDRGDFNSAESHLLRLQDPRAIETNYELVLDFARNTKRVLAFEVLFPRMITSAIASKEIDSADSLAIYQYNYLDLLETIGDWDKMHAYFEANPELKMMDETLATRIDMHIGRGEYEIGLNLLEGALATETVTYPEAAANPNYEDLKTLPRYSEVMALAARNWDASKAKRKQDALAKKISKPAPLWSLPDKDGKLVSLESLRGQIVILDFWATWCNPCLKTMPVLDTWLRENPAKDLSVFSVNTWDTSTPTQQVIAFMEENGYSMTLLFGNNELPKAYGFTGIPFICVIDKQGNIAFEHSGYSRDLPELLSYWVEDLRK